MRLYLFLLAVLWAHSLERAQASWLARLFRRRFRNFARLPASEEPSTHVENFIQVGRQVKRRGGGMAREESAAFRYVQTRVTWLLTFFFRANANASSGSRTNNLDFCRSRVPGLEFVRRVFPSPSRQRSYPKLEAAFPPLRPATVLSALQGTLTQFHVRGNAGYETVEDAHGERYTVKYFFRLREHDLTMSDASFVTNLIAAELRAHEFFRVYSADAVECRFHVKTAKDILIYPGQQACVTCPAGCLLNYFLLYSSAEITLAELVTSMDMQDESPVGRKRATVAALNISLQLLLIVQQVRLKRLILSAFSPEHLHFDATGTLTLYPQFPPWPESMVSFPTPWPGSDFSANAKDTALSLMFIWCHTEVKASFPFFSTVTVEEVKAAIGSSQCSQLPSVVRRLIAQILNEDENLNEITSWPSYKLVESLLKDELHSLHEGATRTEQERV